MSWRQGLAGNPGPSSHRWLRSHLRNLPWSLAADVLCAAFYSRLCILNSLTLVFWSSFVMFFFGKTKFLENWFSFCAQCSVIIISFELGTDLPKVQLSFLAVFECHFWNKFSFGGFIVQTFQGMPDSSEIYIFCFSIKCIVDECIKYVSLYFLFLWHIISLGL